MKKETPKTKAEPTDSSLQTAKRLQEQAVKKVMDVETQLQVLHQKLKTIKREYKVAKKAKRQAKRRLGSAKQAVKEAKAKAGKIKGKKTR